ncbi:mediator of RNA polymerase II transcription subunit 17 [Plectosphaerella plurivora]|uniref:Mediator of RNA polymerase II transcription subunit 17 n=1 Tax=Plectosphaerella plurivora TaxID=936078 RepID=A0A9P8VPW7_9PEZI|nr:mediator of RNA polymerase II transcription subunit 17 [Plectosphaerella plurivora]
MAPTIPGEMPFSSLRPLPVGGHRPKNIGDFIARIQAERGFRNVSEAGLREEIAAKEARAANGDTDDIDMASDADQDDDDESKDVYAVRNEILQNIDVAHNAAMLSLDFVSLLLTKHNPSQAGATLSAALREMAGIGTLGVSKFSDSVQDGDRRRREERRAESRDVALGWSIMDIAQTKTAAEKAAARLARETDREAAYWQEVLAVKQNGWSVCRLPAERHTLGVRFGFTEASPEFRNKSLAPLRRADDGSVVLEHGRSGVGRERVAISITRPGEHAPIGRSVMAPSASSDATAPLQTRVLEARNGIFSQELWHELHRESHQLASYGVRANDNQIIYAPENGPKITFGLEEATEALEALPPSDDASALDHKLAELTQRALHVLLSHAHRQNEVQRRKPSPPHLRRHQQYQQYHLVRPIILRIMHDASIRQTTQLSGRLVQALHRLGFDKASFTLHVPQLPTDDIATPAGASSTRPTPAQTLVNMLTAPADFNVDLLLAPGVRIQIRGRTWFVPFTTTQYQINLLGPDGAANPAANPLSTTFPPYRDGYPDLNSLRSYLLSATSRALVSAYLPVLTSLSPPDDSTSAEPLWSPSVRGNAIQDVSGPETREIQFDFVENVNDPATDDVEFSITALWQIKGEPRSSTWFYSATEQGPDIDTIVRAVAQSSEVV